MISQDDNYTAVPALKPPALLILLPLSARAAVLGLSVGTFRESGRGCYSTLEHHLSTDSPCNCEHFHTRTKNEVINHSIRSGSFPRGTNTDDSLSRKEVDPY